MDLVTLLVQYFFFLSEKGFKMKEELEKKLFDKYPKIFGQKDLPMTQTCMCWGIECGDGWYTIIDALCARIMGYNKSLNWKIEDDIEKGLATEADLIPVIQATQVKEKYGGLRFYTNSTDEYIEGLVSMAEAMSSRTCEECGNPGKQNNDGWITTLCDSCRKEYDAIRSAKWGINQKLET
jgi:hypothetical protein